MKPGDLKTWHLYKVRIDGVDRACRLHELTTVYERDRPIIFAVVERIDTRRCHTVRPGLILHELSRADAQSLAQNSINADQ